MATKSPESERFVGSASYESAARRLVSDALAAEVLEELRLEPIVFGQGHSRFQHSRSMMPQEVEKPEEREADGKGKPRSLTPQEIAGLGQRLRAS